MLKEILEEIKKSTFSIFPIYILIMFLLLTKVIKLEGLEIIYFSISTVIIIIGIAFFNYGANNAMTPIGKKIGRGLTKKGNVLTLMLIIFILGFLITISEPDLSVLALQTSSVFKKYVLLGSISFGVGLFLIIAVLKIIKKLNLIRILSLLYMIAFGLMALLINEGKSNMIALSFDSGGVTTGPMTVPFFMALSVGIANVLAQKSEKDASFGFIAFSSIGPVIVLLILSLFSKGNIDYELPNYEISNNFILSYLNYLLDKLKELGISISLILIFYIIIDKIFLHTDKKNNIILIRGIIFVYLGLVLFLSAVDCIYMGVGYKIGQSLSNQNALIIFIISFIIGSLTILAEPAIKILNNQVEEMTNGLIKRKNIMLALAIGVGVAIGIAMIRILYKFSILYIIIPAYILCFILSFFVPKLYTAIAFDAGGVASGPLTSSFILPIALGICQALIGVDEILLYGFGIVSMVALSPLVAIEILGVISIYKDRIKSRNEIKKVLSEDDKIIITFGD